MGAYILRRLLLIIPTLFGIMVINFSLVQFVPGGPIEQIIAEMQGQGDVFQGIAGGGNDAVGSQVETIATGDERYVGSRGLPPEFIEELEREFGFDKPPLERFLNMMWNYVRLDFGESYFRSIGVIELVMEKLPVSITLGLWSTVIAYLISIPLGIRKAVRDGTSFDTWTSGLIIVAYAIPGFLFAIMLLVLFAGGSYYQIFPLRGLTSDNFDQLSFFGKIGDYLWHITLPVLASTISSFATLTLLTKNSFLDEIKKHYVMTARAKGLSESRVLYGHVFRNAMLIVSDFATEAVYRDIEVKCLIRSGGLEDCWDDPEGIIEAIDEGTFDTATEGFYEGWMIWPIIPYSYDTTVDRPGAAPLPPNDQNILGTDDTKRDLLARILYGFRLSILFTLIVTTLSSIIGIIAGALQGYFGGWVDLIFQRVIEIWGATLCPGPLWVGRAGGCRARRISAGP